MLINPNPEVRPDAEQMSKVRIVAVQRTKYILFLITSEINK